MSAAAAPSHPRLAEAADGGFPPWTRAGVERRAHMLRVAGLMGAWASALRLPPEEALRWRAAGLLHDALREADPAALRPEVRETYPALADFPDPLLHGPAAAARLRAEGLDDGELLDALAFHTTGHRHLGRLGRALYAADFLDPGRAFLPEWREALRERMPMALDEVVREILRVRMDHVSDRGGELRPETLDFRRALGGAA